MKNLKYWIGIAIAAALIVFILVNNKSKLEAGIMKEKNGIHSVTVESVKPEELISKLDYIGITEAVNDIELISETDGKVEKVFVENGSRVTGNSIIVKVDDQILQANYKLAEAALEKAKLDLSRFEALMKEGNLSASDLENSRISLKNAEAQYVIAKKYLSNASIQSPINGIIVNRYVNIGSTVAPGTPIANIVDISRLKIKTGIPEKDITKIKIGQTASVTCNLYPGKTLEAKVKSISVKADESHNYSVELIIDNPKNILSAGMYVDVKFEYTTQGSVLNIPRVSLTGSIKNPKVYVVQNNKAIQRDILIGDEAGDRLIVLKGISEGEQIITEGQNNLQDGSDVIIKNRKSF
ncbi:MAG: efflux RND transporter periplasmic adaptor subunit [Ignavibacteria bacterium]|jgi:RND family efflux transporter MFP subunit